MRPFCQVVEVWPLKWAVIAASPFPTVPGACLATFDGVYPADEYAKRVNKLARVFKRPRASMAKVPA